MKLLLLLAALFSITASSGLQAQYVTRPLGIGVDQRVRVAAPPIFDGKRKGTVSAPVVDTLFLKERAALTPIPVASIAELEVSQGRNRLLWGFLGAVAGGVSGFFLGANMYDTGESDIDGILGAIGGAAVGTVAGGIIGAIAAPERWRSVPLR